MDFTLSERETYFRDRVKAFIDKEIAPRNHEYHQQSHEGDRWKVIPVIEEVKAIAKAQGLWTFFMPPHSGQTHVDDSFEFEGTQLTNLGAQRLYEACGWTKDEEFLHYHRFF
jgi:alkylation response protein AidB-like acyl-CoA dehydrogenase